MKRRDFIKLTAVCAAGIATPIKIFDFRDKETRFLEYISQNYNEFQCVELLKVYGFIESKGMITSWFRAFKDRQPDFCNWLKSTSGAQLYYTQGKERWNEEKEQYTKWAINNFDKIWSRV